MLLRVGGGIRLDTPGHGPYLSWRAGPVFTQQLNRTMLETLHKHLDSKPKIMDNYPRYMGVQNIT